MGSLFINKAITKRGTEPHNICHAVIIKRSILGNLTWILFDKIAPHAQVNPDANANNVLEKLFSIFSGLKTNINSNFSLDKMTSKFGEILDKYVKVQQHIELKLPTIKKL